MIYRIMRNIGTGTGTDVLAVGQEVGEAELKGMDLERLTAIGAIELIDGTPADVKEDLKAAIKRANDAEKALGPFQKRNDALATENDALKADAEKLKADAVAAKADADKLKAELTAAQADAALLAFATDEEKAELVKRQADAQPKA